MDEKRLENIYLKWLPIDIDISVNEYISEYGISLVKIGRYFSLSIHFWKYYLSIPFFRNSENKGKQ